MRNLGPCSSFVATAVAVAVAAIASVSVLSPHHPYLQFELINFNLPALLFRVVFVHLAPAKERIIPSDDPRLLSAESRGLAWTLTSALPPVPHDVDRIRAATDVFWPRVWEGMVPDVLDAVTVEEVDVPPVVPPDGGVGMDDDARRTALLFRPSAWGDDDDDDGDDNEIALVFVHGGGLVAGTPRTELGVSAQLSIRLNCPVLSVDYRLLPEHPIVSSVSDVVAAFDWLVGAYPHRPQIGIVGGSAGGTLALLAGVALRDRVRTAKRRPRVAGDDGTVLPPVPSALGLLSPGPGMEYLTDPPTLTWESMVANADRDGYMRGGLYDFVRGVVFADGGNVDYVRSALSDLTDLPPCLITAGGYEVILDGVRYLAGAVRRDGGGVERVVVHREYDGMQHVHHTMFFLSREAADGLEDVIAFFRAM